MSWEPGQVALVGSRRGGPFVSTGQHGEPGSAWCFKDSWRTPGGHRRVLTQECLKMIGLGSKRRERGGKQKKEEESGPM